MVSGRAPGRTESGEMKPTLESANSRMVFELAQLCQRRYHSALLEGTSEEDAFREIVLTIINTYREAIAS